MSAPQQANEWILPSLTTLNLEGCSSVEWDDLKTLVESRLPSSSASSAAKFSSANSTAFSVASKLAYATYRTSSTGTSSSASQYARVQALADTPYTNHAHLSTILQPNATQPHQPPSQFLTMSKNTHRPSKIARLDLTRCSQISRERIQWLRMYVGEVIVREDPGR
jgi:hypothetical protein